MRHSSGFGWDRNTKKFTADPEVWEEFFKNRPKARHLQTETIADYESLMAVFGSGSASGHTTVGLCDIGNDATPYSLEQNDDTSVHSGEDHYTSEVGIDGLNYDFESQSFLSNEETVTPPPQNTSTNKKRRIEKAEINNSNKGSASVERLDTLNRGIDRIATSFEHMQSLMQKRDKSFDCWDAIKETPDLDEITLFRAFDLLKSRGAKELFVKMTPVERKRWILFKLGMFE
ncbi:hypothetical protein QJS04_geneDACA010809 [Acorus gramineus]|uniref:At2g29880-like C-terminal domain-containing protein n=1 Tax=Acorus gramineus TaxID=55184 RepID=A0AAV9BB86_ACOGR|nr:hypothetical protein QJS04_geneDACA010809 [Acorus gramineus]